MNSAIDTFDAHVRAMLVSGALINVAGVAALATHLPPEALESRNGSDPWWSLAIPLVMGVGVALVAVAAVIIPLTNALWMAWVEGRRRSLAIMVVVVGAVVVMPIPAIATLSVARLVLPGLGPTFLTYRELSLVLSLGAAAHLLVYSLLMYPNLPRASANQTP